MKMKLKCQLLSSLLAAGVVSVNVVSSQSKIETTVPIPQVEVSDQSIFYYGSKEEAKKALIYSAYLQAGQAAFAAKDFAEADRQLNAALTQRGNNDIESAQLLAKTYLAEGKAEQAEALGEKIAESSKNDSIGSLDCLASLSDIYRLEGKYDKAESTLRRELTIAKKEFDDDAIHKKDSNWTGISYLTSNLIHLAIVLQEQHKNEDAVEFLKRALRLEEAGIGQVNPEDPDLILDISMQANLYRNENRDEKFEAELFNNLRMGDAPDMVICLNNIAALYFAEGKFDKAEKVIGDSLEQSQACSFPATEANILKNLAEVYVAEGKLKEARATLLEALAKSKQSLGDKHPDVSKILAVQHELEKQSDRTP